MLNLSFHADRFAACELVVDFLINCSDKKGNAWDWYVEKT